MVSITPPADDHGTQSLKKENATLDTPREVLSTSPYPSVHGVIDETRLPAITRQPVPNQRKSRTQRRRGDRRRQQRRQGQQSVLLDTRGKSERRRKVRRLADVLRLKSQLQSEESAATTPMGIDKNV